MYYHPLNFCPWVSNHPVFVFYANSKKLLKPQLSKVWSLGEGAIVSPPPQSEKKKRPQKNKTALVILYLGTKYLVPFWWRSVLHERQIFLSPRILFLKRRWWLQRKSNFTPWLCWSCSCCVCSFSGNWMDFRGLVFDWRKVTSWIPAHLRWRWKSPIEMRGSSTVYIPPIQVKRGERERERGGELGDLDQNEKVDCFERCSGCLNSEKSLAWILHSLTTDLKIFLSKRDVR